MDLSQVATGQHGVLTRAQALTELSEAALRWRLRRGDWHRVHPGVYQVHNGQLDWFGRASAALLCYGEGAALALESAAFVLGIESRPPALVQVDVPALNRRERRPGVRLRRRRRLETVRRRGLLVTSPDFTVLDLGDLPGASRADAIGVTARAVQRRQATVAGLTAELAFRRTHRHRRALELSLGVVADGAESVLEVEFVTRVLRPHGLPPMRLAVPDWADGRSIRRDFVDDDHGVVMEVDGRLGHEAERGRDIRRDRSTAAEGRITLRCDWVDVCYEPCALAADLHATASRRGFRGPLLACAPGCPAPGLVRQAS